VETKIFDALPDETWVHPGQGNDTTLGAEHPHLTCRSGAHVAGELLSGVRKLMKRPTRGRAPTVARPV
jgi:hypothetical protein